MIYQVILHMKHAKSERLGRKRYGNHPHFGNSLTSPRIWLSITGGFQLRPVKYLILTRQPDHLPYSIACMPSMDFSGIINGFITTPSFHDCNPLYLIAMVQENLLIVTAIFLDAD